MTKEEFELKIAAIEKSNIDDKKLADGWYATTQSENSFRRIDKKSSSPYFINPKPVVLPDNFINSEEFENHEKAKGLAVYFDENGIEAWAKATDDNTGSYLIFILSNEILTVQYVNSQIINGASAFWKSELNDHQWRKIKTMIKNN